MTYELGCGEYCQFYDEHWVRDLNFVYNKITIKLLSRVFGFIDKTFLSFYRSYSSGNSKILFSTIFKQQYWLSLTHFYFCQLSRLELTSHIQLAFGTIYLWHSNRTGLRGPWNLLFIWVDGGSDGGGGKKLVIFCYWMTPSLILISNFINMGNIEAINVSIDPKTCFL